MTTLNVEQIIAANKNAVAEAQGLASTAFEGFEQLVELNLAATKSFLFESSTDYLSVFSAKSPAEALAAQASLVQPLAEKAIAYGRSVYGISSSTGSALSKAAEGKLAEGQKTFVDAVESMAKNAPAGSEPIVAAFKSALSAGQNAIDTAKSSAKKAVEMAEKQATAVTDTAMNAVKTPSRKK